MAGGAFKAQKEERWAHTLSLKDAPFLSLEAWKKLTLSLLQLPKVAKLKPLRLVHFFSMSHLQCQHIKALLGLSLLHGMILLDDDFQPWKSYD